MRGLSLVKGKAGAVGRRRTRPAREKNWFARTDEHAQCGGSLLQGEGGEMNDAPSTSSCSSLDN